MHSLQPGTLCYAYALNEIYIVIFLKRIVHNNNHDVKYIIYLLTMKNLSVLMRNLALFDSAFETQSPSEPFKARLYESQLVDPVVFCFPLVVTFSWCRDRVDKGTGVVGSSLDFSSILSVAGQFVCLENKNQTIDSRLK